VGTDVFHAALLLWAASIGNIILGNVDFALAGLLLVGSIPGVLIGTKVSVRLPALALRCALAGVLLAAAGSLAVKAGLPLPPVGLVIWFAAVAIGVVVMYRRVRESNPELPA
jgi:hypothetical protein